MANKFYGPVGFGSPVELKDGVWDQTITEYHYYGDVVKNTVRFEEAAKVNNDYTTGNSISIVADAYAIEHFFAIRYVEWLGVRWIVVNVEVLRPRLLLRLGGVYNGPTPAEEGTPPGDSGDDPGDD